MVKKRTHSISRIIVIPISVVVGILILTGILLWGIGMPPRNLPEPTGPYPTGTFTVDMTDKSRQEVYSHDPDTYRKIRVQFWYPSLPENGSWRRSNWMPDGLEQVKAIVEANGFPSFLWNHTINMKANSLELAPLRSPEEGGLYPLIIISHGWKGYRGLHADIAEELASYGYIVAAADHSYGAAAVRFDNGTIIQASSEVLPERSAGSIFLEKALTLETTFSRDNSFILNSLRQVGSTDEANRLGGVLATAGNGDLRRELFMKLATAADTERVGVIGHSTGGGAMQIFAMSESRVRAYVGLDAWVEPLGNKTAIGGADIPSLYLRSQAWEGGINDSFLLPLVKASGQAQLYQIQDITHLQFSNLYMYAPAMKWVGMMGAVDPFDFGYFQRNTLADFFLEMLPSRSESTGAQTSVDEYDDHIRSIAGQYGISILKGH